MSSSELNNSNCEIISVGIIGNSNNSYSKQWVCKQIVSNKITNSVSSDYKEEQCLNDPFEWIRKFQSIKEKQNDKCSQKV